MIQTFAMGVFYVGMGLALAVSVLTVLLSLLYIFATVGYGREEHRHFQSRPK